MTKFNRTFGSEGYIKTLLGVLFIFLFTSCSSSSSPSSPSGEGGLKIYFQNPSLKKAEGENFVFTLEIDATNEQDISFNWSIEHGTTSNDDFLSATNGTSGIATDSTITAITIQTRNNDIFEGNENFRLKIENIRGATLDDLQTTGTITDEADKPTISLDAITKESQEGNAFTWIVQLSKSAEQVVSFEWSIEHVTTDNNDFSGATNGINAIEVGRTTTDITIQTSNDSIFEKNESFKLNITSISGATPDNLQATGTIAGDNKKLINIATATELNNVRFNLAGTSYKTSLDDTGVNCDDASCEGYELTGNIDLRDFNDGDWEPLRGDTSFTSTLKGNGYSISGLNINELNTNRVGLFASLLGANIDNLIIKVKIIKGGKFVGALAGSSKNSMIDNLQIKKTDANSMLQTSGGDAGALIGDVYNSVITNAFSDLNIRTGSSSVENVGGLVGIASANSQISYSAASGKLQGDGSYYGGLVGFMQSNSQIRDSTASGNLQGSGSQYGGLVGHMQSSAQINYSAASGNLQGSGSKHGGLVGNMVGRSKVNNSTASGNLQGSGTRYGGLVGAMQGESQINYSTASGNLQGSGSQYGGLVGYVDLFAPTIANNWASGSVRGRNTIGSFVGETNININYNYSLGTALGNSNIGFIGSNTNTATNTATNNYWNSETSGITNAVGVGDSGGISSSITASMLSANGSSGNDNVFRDWSSQIDASKANMLVWRFKAGNYPVLRGQDATSQAINLAYGLLRLASGNNADSFLGGTLINEDITIDVNNLSENDFAILDVNLRAPNDADRSDFFACTGGNTLVSKSVNGTRVELSINQDTSSNLLNGLDFNNNNCSVSFKNNVTPRSGNKLRLDAKISKGKASQTKMFIIRFEQ